MRRIRSRLDMRVAAAPCKVDHRAGRRCGAQQFEEERVKPVAAPLGEPVKRVEWEHGMIRAEWAASSGVRPPA
jgi:hypothetical protein